MSNAATATSLGLVEVPFFSIAAVVADDLAKAAEVVILGFEPLGKLIAAHVIARPHDELRVLLPK